MNFWTRLLLHLRRAKLRRLFFKHWPSLDLAFKSALLEQNKSQKRRWLDVEWISEPILYVLPDAEKVSMALVGVAAIYELVEDEEKPTVQTQAGTALFAYESNAWTTQGKLLLNLTPSQALAELQKTTSVPV